MHPDTKMVHVPMPIVIDGSGHGHPSSAPVSIQYNGGAVFISPFDCILTFHPSCPFANCNNNQLTLTQRRQQEALAIGVTEGTYFYDVVPLDEFEGRHGHRPKASPQDVVITS